MKSNGWEPHQAVKHHFRKPRVVTATIALLTFAVTMSSVAPTSQAYTPDDPKVQAICEKAVRFMEKAQPGRGEAQENKLGGQAVIALAIYKYYRRFGGSFKPKTHPKVQKAIARCKSVANNATALQKEDNYSVGIALIFLAEVDSSGSYSEIGKYTQEILRRQKSHGGWGYENSQAGDTSQMQYAVLGLWSAMNSGVSVGAQPVERVAKMIASCQEKNGGWGYQVWANRGDEDITFCRTAAALGSLYVCADYLGFSKTKPDEDDKNEIKTIILPPALIPVIETDGQNDGVKRKRIQIRSSMNYNILQKAFDGGNGHMGKRKLEEKEWQYYYIYAIERYESFRELVEGYYVKEPKWYNDGVDFLASKQAGNGTFAGSGRGAESEGLQVGAAFATLFLLRSTRDSINRVVNTEGSLRGGYGLPADVSEVRLTQDNKIQAPKVTVEMDDIMGLIEDGENAEMFDDMIKNPDAYSIGGMKASGSKEYALRLRRVLRSGSWQARIVAARILGLQGDLDNVPILIYALTDPNKKVVREARDGLRLTSRKFDGYDLPDVPKPPELNKAIADWKTWYKTVRPDAGFIEVTNTISSASRDGGSDGQ